jgi:hypothetical protein
MFLDRLAIAALAWTSNRLCALYTTKTQLAPKPKPIPYSMAPKRRTDRVRQRIEPLPSIEEDSVEVSDVRAPDADLLRSMDLLEEGAQSW